MASDSTKEQLSRNSLIIPHNFLKILSSLYYITISAASSILHYVELPLGKVLNTKHQPFMKHAILISLNILNLCFRVSKTFENVFTSQETLNRKYVMQRTFWLYGSKKSLSAKSHDDSLSRIHVCHGLVTFSPYCYLQHQM